LNRGRRLKRFAAQLARWQFGTRPGDGLSHGDLAERVASTKLLVVNRLRLPISASSIALPFIWHYPTLASDAAKSPSRRKGENAVGPGLQGKHPIVTGGSWGIGKAIARELAREGVDVAIIARTKADLEATARELAVETNRRIVPFAADVASKGELDRLVADTYCWTEGWCAFP
jgi:hypothetical protein